MIITSSPDGTTNSSDASSVGDTGTDVDTSSTVSGVAKTNSSAYVVFDAAGVSADVSNTKDSGSTVSMSVGTVVSSASLSEAIID